MSGSRRFAASINKLKGSVRRTGYTLPRLTNFNARENVRGVVPHQKSFLDLLNEHWIDAKPHAPAKDQTPRKKEVVTESERLHASQLRQIRIVCEKVTSQSIRVIVKLWMDISSADDFKTRTDINQIAALILNHSVKHTEGSNRKLRLHILHALGKHPRRSVLPYQTYVQALCDKGLFKAALNVIREMNQVGLYSYKCYYPLFQNVFTAMDTRACAPVLDNMHYNSRLNEIFPDCEEKTLNFAIQMLLNTYRTLRDENKAKQDDITSKHRPTPELMPADSVIRTVENLLYTIQEKKMNITEPTFLALLHPFWCQSRARLEDIADQVNKQYERPPDSLVGLIVQRSLVLDPLFQSAFLSGVRYQVPKPLIHYRKLRAREAAPRRAVLGASTLNSLVIGHSHAGRLAVALRAWEETCALWQYPSVKSHFSLMKCAALQQEVDLLWQVWYALLEQVTCGRPIFVKDETLDAFEGKIFALPEDLADKRSWRMINWLLVSTHALKHDDGMYFKHVLNSLKSHISIMPLSTLNVITGLLCNEGKHADAIQLWSLKDGAISNKTFISMVRTTHSSEHVEYVKKALQLLLDNQVFPSQRAQDAVALMAVRLHVSQSPALKKQDLRWLTQRDELAKRVKFSKVLGHVEQSAPVRKTKVASTPPPEYAQQIQMQVKKVFEELQVAMDDKASVSDILDRIQYLSIVE